MTALLGNHEINSFENNQESKHNTTEEKHESRKNIAILNNKNISNEFQKASIKKEIARDELIEKKDGKFEKFAVLEKESIENISDNNQNNPV